jgi:hypothetical protein
MRTPNVYSIEAATAGARGEIEIGRSIAEAGENAAKAATEYLREANEKDAKLGSLEKSSRYRAELDLQTKKAEEVADADTYYGTVMTLRRDLGKSILGEAKNDRERELLVTRMLEYNIQHDRHVLEVSGKKRIDDLELKADLTLDRTASKAIVANDPRDLQREIGEGLAAIETLRGVHPELKVKELADKYMERITKGRLQAEIQYRPEYFFAEGYKQYGPGGMFPTTKPEDLSDAMKHAFAAARANRREYFELKDRADKESEKETKTAVESRYIEWYTRLTAPGQGEGTSGAGAVIATGRPSVREVEAYAPVFAQYVGREAAEKLLRIAREPYLEGGRTDPYALRALEIRVTLDDPSITANRILNYPGVSDQDKVRALKDWEKRQKDEDVSKHWGYKLGRESIRLRIGGAVNEFGMQILRPEEREALADALDTFEHGARSGKIAAEALPDYAKTIIEQIEKKYGLGIVKPEPSPKPAQGPGWLNFFKPAR